MPSQLAAGAERWPLLLPVALALGIGVYFTMHSEPPWWPTLVAGGVGTLLVVVVRRRGLAGIGALVLALAVVLGFAAAQIRTATVGTVPAGATGWAMVTGTVRTVERRASDIRITLDRAELSESRIDPAPSSVRLVVRGVAPPTVGARIRMRARIGPPSPPIAPGAFDFQRHAFFAGIGAVGFAVGDLETLAPGLEGSAGDRRWDERIDRLRQRIADRVRSVLGEPAGPIAAALLTGDRSGIAEPVLDDLRVTGLAHLLAISGLHMALVAGTVMVGVRFGLAAIPAVALRLPIKKLAAVVAMLAATAYLLLAGAPVPTQRAYLMILIVLAAVLLDRDPVSLRLVALAATVVLLLRPESLLGPSFQMSFAAVTGLIAVYELLRGWRDRRLDAGFDARPGPVGRAGAYVAGVALTSLIASAATAPFAAHHFQLVPLVGTVANLVAVPVTAFLTMPAGVLALIAMPLGIEAAPLWLMSQGIQATLWSAETARDVPWASVRVPPAPAAMLTLLSLGAVWFVVWRGALRWGGLVAVGIALWIWSGAVPPSVIVSADARVVGLRFQDGHWAVSTDRRARFIRDGWRSRWGGVAERSFERFEAETPGRPSDAARFGCDGLGCVLRMRGQSVLVTATAEAAAEDCEAATIVVAQVPLRRACDGPELVVDLKDVRALGAHAIWLHEDGADLVTDFQRRGDRPWVQRD